MPIIRKFPLTYRGRDSVVMPKGAVLLHAESINLKVYLWAAIDTKEDLEVRTFELIGDEFEVPEDGQYIDSVVSDGELSWHVFEINPPEPPPPSVSVEEYTENVLAGDVQEPMRISKSTYEMMLKKIPPHNAHALDPDSVKYTITAREIGG